MASPEESRAKVHGALARLGWEVLAEGAEGVSDDTVVGGRGKHYPMVSFGEDGLASAIISRVGGGLLGRGWPGVERLPTPRKVIRALLQQT